MFKKTMFKRIVLISSIILAAGVLTYYLANDSSKTRQESEVSKNSKIKITADTEIVQRIIYSKCGDEEVLKFKPTDNIVGLNIAQLKNIYSGWTINRFDNNIVEMSYKADGYCREHANNQFLSIKDGYVAVFYGRPGPKALLKEVTKIPVNHLNPSDLRELQQGLVVQSRQDLLQTLEGMQSR